MLLNESAVCNRDSDEIDNKKIKRIEYWCNRFAGAFLVPEDFLEKELGIETLRKTTHYSRIAGSIANRFKISKESALMRLLTLDYINASEFRTERDKIRTNAALKKEQIKEKQRQSAKKSGPAIFLDQKCLDEKGHRFVSLVLKNSDLGYITSKDALDYLDVKLRHLEKLRA
jgi:Zn-dependent peptidase ImmA (M78 family)